MINWFFWNNPGFQKYLGYYMILQLGITLGIEAVLLLWWYDESRIPELGAWPPNWKWLINPVMYAAIAGYLLWKK